MPLNPNNLAQALLASTDSLTSFESSQQALLATLADFIKTHAIIEFTYSGLVQPPASSPLPDPLSGSYTLKLATVIIDSSAVINSLRGATTGAITIWQNLIAQQLLLSTVAATSDTLNLITITSPVRMLSAPLFNFNPGGSTSRYDTYLNLANEFITKLSTTPLTPTSTAISVSPFYISGTATILPGIK